MRNTDVKTDASPIDLTGLFGDLRDTLRLLVVGMKDLVLAAKAEQGTFASYAGGGLEMPLQKGVNGVIRMLHNQSAGAITVLIVDGNESNLVGSPYQSLLMPPGSIEYVFIPFKAGLRATVGPVGTAANLLVTGTVH